MEICRARRGKEWIVNEILFHYRAVDDEEEEAEFDETEVKQPEKKPKKASASSTTNSSSNNSGEVFFSLGQKKKISLSKFKGKVYINIREYYTDDSGADKVIIL